MVLKSIGNIIQSEPINKLLQSEVLVQTITKLISSSTEVRDAIETHVNQTLHNLSLARLDELEAMRSEVERLEDEVNALRTQLRLLSLAQTARASKASAVKTPTSNQPDTTTTEEDRPDFSDRMKKSELLLLCAQYSIEVSDRATKKDLLEALSHYFA